MPDLICSIALTEKSMKTQLRFIKAVRGVRVGQTMDAGPRLRKAAARAKGMLLAFALALGAASTASAVPVTIDTDTSWLVTNASPASTWNTDPSFDTTGWINATVQLRPECTVAPCIWYDGQFSSTQFVWLRRVFTLSDPVSAAFLVGGVDDDADIYLNGALVFSDHDGFATAFGPLDIAALLVPGINLIAVAASDNFPVFGQNHAFAASLQIQTRTPNRIPEPPSLVLLGVGLAALAFLQRRQRQG